MTAKTTPRELLKYWRRREQQKVRALKYKYGITPQDWQSMFDAQAGRCKICRKHQSEIKHSLSVDHCHESGKVRGLLCNACNTGIGLFEENLSSLESAVSYLKRNEGPWFQRHHKGSK